jgi:cell division protease FtsH
MSAITKDSVRLALFDGRDRVGQHDIELAFQEQAMGLENPIEEMEEDQRRQVAYHEAGHAVVQYHLRPDERIVRVSIVRRSEALGYVLPVPNYDIYSLPLRTFLADIMVSMAGHVATKIFLGEYWTGATSDFQQVRGRLWQLTHYGFFGPPLDVEVQPGMAVVKDQAGVVEKFWRKLEEQTEEILAKHAAEVHAVAQALLERNDLTGKECIQVIRAASTSDQPDDSEALLKALVEETMVNGKNGKSEKKAKPKRKAAPRLKAKNE